MTTVTQPTGAEKLPVVVEFLPGMSMDKGYAKFVPVDRVYFDHVTIRALLGEAVEERADPRQADVHDMLAREWNRQNDTGMKQADRVIIKGEPVVLTLTLESILGKTVRTSKGTVEAMAVVDADPNGIQFYHVRARYAAEEQGGA